MHKHKIAPSLLSADFTRLRDEISSIQDAGADLLHLDVMDGHFVPNLTIGPFIVKAIRQCTPLPLDVHLMIDHPSKFIEPFIGAGANMISFHVEIPEDKKDILSRLKKLNIKAGLALNPSTPIEKIVPFLTDIDYILIMSVHPGFAGQSFEPSVLSKIEDLSLLRKRDALSFEIEIDGGINTQTISKAAQVGANIFVAGSAIFKTPPYKNTIEALRKAAHV